MKKKKELALDLFMYIFFGLIALGGFVMIILHLVNDYDNTLVTNSNLYKAESSFASAMKMSWLTFGFILLLAGVIALTIYLTVTAKRHELASDNANKRAPRLASIEKDAVTSTK